MEWRTEMTAGRPRKNPRRSIIFRLDETILAELYALHPTILNPMGQVRYGAMNEYLTGIVIRDLESRRRSLQKAVANA
jgi:predicted transcriptional regulator